MSGSGLMGGKRELRKREAEGNRHAGMDILYQVRMPARVYVLRKGLKDIIIQDRKSVV